MATWNHDQVSCTVGISFMLLFVPFIARCFEALVVFIFKWLYRKDRCQTKNSNSNFEPFHSIFQTVWQFTRMKIISSIFQMPLSTYQPLNVIITNEIPLGNVCCSALRTMECFKALQIYFHSFYCRGYKLESVTQFPNVILVVNLFKQNLQQNGASNSNTNI